MLLYYIRSNVPSIYFIDKSDLILLSLNVMWAIF